MIAMMAASLMVLQASTGAAPEPVLAVDWAAPRIDQAVIRQAVRETLVAERDAVPARRHENDTLRGDRYQSFAAEFAEARVPDCLHSEGLKRQPTSIGPFGVGGLLALPFVAVAKLRGKCN
ncbi:MAG: hypothetical protein V4508_02755 [Pseudomonadota bacterium]